MALRLSQEEFTRGVQTYSRDMYRAARALTPCDADAQDAVGQAVLLAWQSLDRLRDPEALRAWLVKIRVVLYYYEDLPVADIASLLRVPAGTVKSRLSRARDKLRLALSDPQATRKEERT